MQPIKYAKNGKKEEVNMKKKLVKGLSIAMVCVMCAGLAACSGSGNDSTDSGEAQTEGSESSGDSIKIAQSIPTLNNPWYVEFSNGSKDMAAELGVELTQVTNSEANAWEPSEQISKIENLIATSPDAISIDPTSTDGINTAVGEAMNKDIPVVMSGTKVSAEVSASITADNTSGGRLCGEYLVEQLGGEGKVAMLLGTPGRDVIEARQDGFRDAIGESNIEIAAEQVANLERAEAVTVMETILQANPDIDAVWCANDEMALGAIEALRSVGKVGEVLVGGFDASPDGVEAISNGEMQFTANQIPYEMGARAITTATLLAQGKTVDETDLKLEMTLISAEDVEEYLANEDARNQETIERIKAEYGF